MAKLIDEISSRRVRGDRLEMQTPPNSSPRRRRDRGVRKRVLIGLTAAAFALLPPGPAADAACSKLPPAVPDRIGRVLVFLRDLPDKSVLAGKYDMIWGDYFNKPGWAPVPGIYSMKYMMAARDPNPYAHEREPEPDTHDNLTKDRDLHWYHENHPDWVVYKLPGEPEPPLCQTSPTENGPNNPAYSCFFRNSVDLVPLDITNPAVREFLFKANLESPPYAAPFRAFAARGSAFATYPSALSSGLYDAVAVDNLSADNQFGAAGIYRDGTFIRKYSGQKVDPQYTKALADWMVWLGAKVHAAGHCLAGNDYFRADNPQGFLDIAAPLDIVFDEHGFADNSGPMDTGADWRSHVEALRRLTAQDKPLAVENNVDARPPDPSGPRTMAPQISWSIANYLLIKGDHTYLVIRSKYQGADPSATFPELFIKVGRPLGGMQTDNVLYWRRFEHALAIVNPSATTGRFDLGAAPWRSLHGRSVSGSVQVPPGTALVLSKEAS
jgi:hypothetical protein